MKHVAVLGGGSSAYSAICLLSQAGYRVSLLTSRPSEWSREVSCEVYGPTHEVRKVMRGRLDRVSGDPGDIIPAADIAVICAPVHTYRSFVETAIAAVRDREKPFSLGAVYGQGGFDWMVESALRRNDLRCPVDYWAAGLLPWICRTKRYGQSGTNYGAKYRNLVATSSEQCFERLNDRFLPALCESEFGHGAFQRADSFLSLTLAVDNQIIHPARSYGLGVAAPDGWDSELSIPYFYRDFDEYSADILSKIDAEYGQIRSALKARFAWHSFTHMLGYLDLDRYSYGREPCDVRSSFTQSKTLWSIKPPVTSSGGRWRLDFAHRFFRDDLYYGLDIAKWFASRLHVHTPMLDAIRAWALAGMSEQGVPSDEPPGTPELYGFDDVDLLLRVR